MFDLCQSIKAGLHSSLSTASNLGINPGAGSPHEECVFWRQPAQSHLWGGESRGNGWSHGAAGYWM